MAEAATTRARNLGDNSLVEVGYDDRVHHVSELVYELPAQGLPCAGGGHFVTCDGLRVVLPLVVMQIPC
ncbi:hypothetical protein [Tunturiibacter gelidiferens]|uniref:hypothetical protein n=1 Tax=Tunturiibacter gelidiferens TaxID=3069689 RepID=UPI003D9ABE29